MISVIVPVFNEEENVNQCIEKLSMQKGVNFEIIVVDGHQKANTLKAIKEDSVIKVSSNKGRAVQMNKGAAVAKGEYLVFLHVDTLLPENGLKLIKETLDSGHKIGAFTLRYEYNGFIEKLGTGYVNFRIKFTNIPYGDQCIFVTRELFDEISGYNNEYPIMEDLDFVKRVKRTGVKIKMLDEHIVTSLRRWRKYGYFKRIAVNMWMVLLFKLGVHPRDLVKYYRSN